MPLLFGMSGNVESLELCVVAPAAEYVGAEMYIKVSTFSSSVAWYQFKANGSGSMEFRSITLLSGLSTRRSMPQNKDCSRTSLSNYVKESQSWSSTRDWVGFSLAAWNGVADSCTGPFTYHPPFWACVRQPIALLTPRRNLFFSNPRIGRLGRMTNITSWVQ